MRSLYHQEKKIATPIALAILIILLIAIAVSIQKIKTTATRAQTSTIAGIEITNITANSASIVWHTPQKTTGWVVWDENKENLSERAFDDRDGVKQTSSYTLHYVTIKNLAENTTYFFNILSNNQKKTAPDHAPFFFKTSARYTIQNSIKPAFGKVINTNGEPVANGLVLLKIDGAVPLSTLTKTTGEWLIPLYYLYNSKTGQTLIPTPETPLSIEIYNDLNQFASVTTTVAHVSPVPQTTVIGQKYRFQEETTNVLGNTNINPSSNTPPTIIAIIFPKEAAIIPGRRPLIKGTAPPGTVITLTIRPRLKKTILQSASVKSDSDGIWTFIPSFNLPEENHTVTITATDITGQLVSKTRSFTIAQSGSAVLGEATPEASLTPTSLPSVLSPTLQPTAAKTPTPSAPVTGIADFSLPLIGTGLLILGAGFLFL